MSLHNKTWSPRQIFSKKLLLERFKRISIQKNDFENQNFAISVEILNHFGKSDDNII